MFGSIRKNCSQCGGPIEWHKPGEVNGKPDGELLAIVKRAEEFMGEPVESVWRCTNSACAEVGFVSGVHAEF